MNTIQPETWKQDLPAFREKTAAFYAGELDKAAYKGFSGLYGSYAQKGGKANMLRLRMTAGRVTPEKLAFTARVIQDYRVPRIHFTTCQTIRLHDLDGQTAGDIMEAALEAGIVTLGGGGDYPRNVMCSPLSGTEADEYFDVLPWAEAAGEYLMTLIKAEKMPRKLKVGFSSSPKNVTHATYRDLGFAARPDGKFDVYSAGGLGNNPRFGVKTAEAVEPAKILYYIKAMWLTFLAYGNYENRGRARTRYMQETCGGPEGYVRAYREKLEEVLTSGENLELDLHPAALEKTGDGSQVSGPRVLEQKQQGLYTVVWHPIGGQPDPAVLCAVSDAMEKMPGAELRLSPDQTAYLVNLNGAETLTMLDLTRNSARTLFESSVSCIGGTVCQVGIRDSQGLLAACVAAAREADLPDGALPQIHISGCPSSCGTHQTGSLGFRGASRLVDGKPQSAFTLFVGGDGRQGSETMGRELGVMLEARIPAFLVEVGRAAAARGFAAWREAEPAALEEIAAGYLA
mgnify:FL=1